MCNIFGKVFNFVKIREQAPPSDLSRKFCAIRIMVSSRNAALHSANIRYKRAYSPRKRCSISHWAKFTAKGPDGLKRKCNSSPRHVLVDLKSPVFPADLASLICLPTLYILYSRYKAQNFIYFSPISSQHFIRSGLTQNVNIGFYSTHSTICFSKKILPKLYLSNFPWR